MLADLARSQGGTAPRKGAVLPAGAWVRSVYAPGAEQYAWCPWCRRTVMLRS
jgi:hypothetical protein